MSMMFQVSVTTDGKKECFAKTDNDLDIKDEFNAAMNVHSYWENIRQLTKVRDDKVVIIDNDGHVIVIETEVIDKRINYFALEYGIVGGHYRYLSAVTDNQLGFLTTDAPSEAMHWRSRENAEAFLNSLPFKVSFHVQSMITEDEDLEYQD